MNTQILRSPALVFGANANKLQARAQRIFDAAEIQIGGHQPWDIKVHDPRFYYSVLAGDSLAAGEAYMRGWWSSDSLDQFFTRFFQMKVDVAVRRRPPLGTLLLAQLGNMQTKRRARHVIERHYDISPDVYMSFLDPYNQYTCGYFKDTDDLNQAQENKLDLICRKLSLQPSDEVLDIGCGWGGFAKFAASRYGCNVTGISISDAQLGYAREFCRDLPVNLLNCDYRDLPRRAGKKFDKILVCGMIEHVGHKNYRKLIQTAAEMLKPGGLFLLHTIGWNTSGKIGEPWLRKYIFPNYLLPSPAYLTDAAEGLLTLEDWHNFGEYYDPTLMAWHANFERNWPAIKSNYTEQFRRMFKFYFLSCAGLARARRLQLWQIVFSKDGYKGTYRSAR